MPVNRRHVNRSGYRSLTDWHVVSVTVAIVIGILFVLALFLRLRLVYQTVSELAALKVETTKQAADLDAHRRQMEAELNAIKQTIYGPMNAAAPPVRRPSVVETWQVNRDRELRSRTNALEAWRLRTEQP